MAKRILQFSLGKRQAIVAAKLVPTADGLGERSESTWGTVSATLEIDVEKLADMLVPRAAFARSGRAALAGGAIMVKVRR